MILSPKIQDFVTTSVSAAFPWTLKVDSIDFITILYSLLIVCHSILYSATVDKLEMKHDLSPDTEITANHINDTFCLSDWLFWFILFLQFFLLLEITSSVSIIYISVLYSLNFTMLLYAACVQSMCCVWHIVGLPPLGLVYGLVPYSRSRLGLFLGKRGYQWFGV